jgi:hypothetical protein
MREKRLEQIERRIEGIKKALLEISTMRPGSLTLQYKDRKTMHRGLLADQLYPSNEEPHGVCAPGMGQGTSPPHRDPQAIQATG